MAAAVLNIGLDLLLVIVFHMGVEGVAYATIISRRFRPAHSAAPGPHQLLRQAGLAGPCGLPPSF